MEGETGLSSVTQDLYENLSIRGLSEAGQTIAVNHTFNHHLHGHTNLDQG